MDESLINYKETGYEEKFAEESNLRVETLRDAAREDATSAQTQSRAEEPGLIPLTVGFKGGEAKMEDKEQVKLLKKLKKGDTIEIYFDNGDKATAVFCNKIEKDEEDSFFEFRVLFNREYQEKLMEKNRIHIFASSSYNGTNIKINELNRSKYIDSSFNINSIKKLGDINVYFKKIEKETNEVL